MILKNIEKLNLTKIIENTLEIILKCIVLFSMMHICAYYFNCALVILVLFFLFYKTRYNFIFYILCIIAFLGTFFVEYRVLHFEHWLVIISIIYLAQIAIWSPLKKVWNRLEFLVLVIVISVIFELLLVGYPKLIIKILTAKELILDIKSSIALIIINLYLYSRSIKEIEIEVKANELYPERINDKNFILKFLGTQTDINILGIEDDFGEGKTFLIDKIIEELDENKFEVIKIRCLSPDTEDIYSYIIKQLNKVLIKNNIYTGHYEGIRDSLIQIVIDKLLGNLSNPFIKRDGIDDIENFKKAILTLDKNIVLIFDDLDRVSNKEKIDKIFSFIGDFTGKNIKALVLYNGQNLKMINSKYNRNYLEKYIPQIITLTKLSFKDLLEKELKKYNIQKTDFDFLISIMTNDTTIYNRDSERQFKELKFSNDFYELTGLGLFSQIIWTPRNIKNFVSETFQFFSIDELKIDKRIIVAFVFCKNIMYDEFYQKIDNNLSFEDLFPIKIKLLPSNIELTLEELDLIKKLLLEEKNIFFCNEVASSLKIGNKRIFFLPKDNHSPHHLNKYLKKLNIDKLEDFLAEEIRDKLNHMREILQTNKVEIIPKEELKNNTLIYELFNYFLLSKNNEYDAIENNENIITAIRKLKFIGNQIQFSKYRKFYTLIKKVLSKPTQEERSQNYAKLLDDYFKENISDTIFLFGDDIQEKTMKVLEIFKDEVNKKEFLDLVLYQYENLITDSYLLAFFRGNFKDVKLSDFIIDKFIKKEFKIKNKNTLITIRKSIFSILKREEYILGNPNEITSNKQFYEDCIWGLQLIIDGNFYERGLNELVKESKTIKNELQKKIKFLEILIELENDPVIEDRAPFKISSEAIEADKTKRIKKLSNEEKIIEMEKIYSQGLNLEALGAYYETIKTAN